MTPALRWALTLRTRQGTAVVLCWLARLAAVGPDSGDHLVSMVGYDRAARAVEALVDAGLIELHEVAPDPQQRGLPVHAVYRLAPGEAAPAPRLVPEDPVEVIAGIAAAVGAELLPPGEAEEAERRARRRRR